MTLLITEGSGGSDLLGSSRNPSPTEERGSRDIYPPTACPTSVCLWEYEFSRVSGLPCTWPSTRWGSVESPPSESGGFPRKQALELEGKGEGIWMGCRWHPPWGLQDLPVPFVGAGVISSSGRFFFHHCQWFLLCCAGRHACLYSWVRSFISLLCIHAYIHPFMY